jgi:hypothetical protein
VYGIENAIRVRTGRRPRRVAGRTALCGAHTRPYFGKIAHHYGKRRAILQNLRYDASINAFTVYSLTPFTGFNAVIRDKGARPAEYGRAENTTRLSGNRPTRLPALFFCETPLLHNEGK